MALHRRTVLMGTTAGVGSLTLGLTCFGAGKSFGNVDASIARGESFPKIPVGMNLAAVKDYSPGFPFKNLFLGARPWLTRNVEGRGPHDTKQQHAFSYDDDGYPLQVPVSAPGLNAQQVVFTYVPNRRKPGKYLLLYDGEGEIEGLAATKIIGQQSGRLILQMEHDPQRPEAIVIKRSELGNHIRNIRLVAAEHENCDLDQEPFLPEFLEFCQPFHCLRFMEWAGTNNSAEERWSDRKRPSFYTMVAKSGDPDGISGPSPNPFELMYSGGVAIELMIKLCNDLQTDAWFCVPHRATDEYIIQFAKLVRDKLDPKLKVYLEYSNELWNWKFQQAGWMLRSPLAGALVEASGGKAWKDESKAEGVGHPERIGALFRRVFSIWEREWGAEHKRRLVRVCAVQAAWFDASRRTIDWCLKSGGADVVSPAAYFGPDKEIYEKWANLGAELTAENVIEDMRTVLRNQRADSGLVRTVNFARQRGLPFVAYEGGQHIQPKGQADLPYNHALAEAQMHPNMYDVYVELFRLIRDVGCELFMHFNSIGQQGARWGSWGAKADYSIPDDKSPKMKALLDCNVGRQSISVR